MRKDQFVDAVFEAARARHMPVRINARGVDSICFNERSNKWLTRDHVAALFDAGIHRPGNETADFRRMIEAVAPGRPCTHRGMREIVQRIVPKA